VEQVQSGMVVVTMLSVGDALAENHELVTVLRPAEKNKYRAQERAEGGQTGVVARTVMRWKFTYTNY
jgi:hypothetical protein